MKLATAMFVFVLSVPAAAQDAGWRVPTAIDSTAVASAEPAALSAQQPVARPAERKRRGSMVGYIQDASIDSQVRVRFDAGFHNDTPDRAEFFYAKCGCYRQLVGDPAFDPNSPGPGPGIVTDLNFQQAYLQGQYAATDRVAVFAEIPVRWIQPTAFDPKGPPGTFGNQAGLSDLRAGVKLGLVSTPVTAVTLQVQGYFRTGDALKGLGTHHNSVEPALLGLSKINDRVAVEWQIGDWHPIGGSAGVPISSPDKFTKDVVFYGIGPSYEVVSTDRVRFGPVIELVGWRLTGGFQTGPGAVDGLNIVNLKFGARAVFNDQGSIYAGYGKALTTAVWYDDIFRVEYRFSF